jgi:hypothetical protein
MLRSFATILICSLALQGCCRLGHKISVAVVDGETNQPIPASTIDVIYGEGPWDYAPWLFWFRPCEASAQAGSDGVARIKLTGAGPRWVVSAPTYLKYFTDAREEIPDDFVKTEVAGKTTYGIPLYREPAPQMVIIVPDGYRGSVRVTRTLSDRWVQNSPGQRVFEFQASPEGDVQIEATPLLHRIKGSEYSESRFGKFDPNQRMSIEFRYANGQKIPRTSGSVFWVIKKRRDRGDPANDIARPPEFGVDLVASGISDDSVDTTVKRTLFVVGGAEEFVRVYEKLRPGYGNHRMDDLFEAAWNVR